MSNPDLLTETVGVDLPMMALWVADFFSSPEVLDLSADDQGAYLLLLSREWQFGGRGLPCAHKCRRICGYGERRWRTLNRTVIRRFFVESDGRLYNPWLESELRKAAKIKRSRSEAGRRGGAASRASNHTPSKKEASSTSTSASEERGRPLPSEAEAALPAQEDAGGVWWRLTHHPWSFRSNDKVMAIIERGTTEEDLDAWEEFAAEHGQPAASSKIQEFRRAQDIPVASTIDRARRVRDDRRAHILHNVERAYAAEPRRVNEPAQRVGGSLPEPADE